MSAEVGLPLQTDLIICNPPWLEASKIPKEVSPLDNAVYDPESQFLKSALNFARLHLKKQGQMLLIYSDLGYQLGLVGQTHI
jgi:tRNA1(Val) A37 N6-methylase TrmN6